LVAFVFSILVSLPLMAFNNWWIKQVNAATIRMLGEAQLTHAEWPVCSNLGAATTPVSVEEEPVDDRLRLTEPFSSDLTRNASHARP
jgi:hypothetical protein